MVRSSSSFAQLSLATVSLLLLLLFPGLCRSAAASQRTFDLSSLAERDRRLSEDPYVSFSPRGLGWCAAECKRRTRCLSFSFRRANLTCELNDKASGDAGATLVSEAGTMFSDSSSWPDVSLCRA